MTIHHAQGDTNELRSMQLLQPVIALENTNAEESTQLALRLKEKIENYEFYLSEDKHTIIAALYYPSETVVAFLDQNKSKKYSKYKLNSHLRSVFYLTGGALTISGVISGDGSDGKNTGLILGLVILAGTYFYDLLTQ